MSHNHQPALLSRRAAMTLLATAATVVATPAHAVGAVKHYIIIELKPGWDQIVLDRWYLTFHAPQVRRAFKAWQRNYVSFRSYAVPEEAARLGVKYGRMTEIQFDTIEDYRETRPNNIYGVRGSYTPPPGGWSELFVSTTATVPVNPNELYLSTDTPPKETPYLRWIIFYRYPKEVSLETGDAWMRDVHTKELAKVTGLKRFAGYKAVSEAAEFPRVFELWFDDYAAWRKAIIDPAPKLTAPPWGGSFPFGETISMFIGENPDIDFVHDKRVIP